MGRMIKKIAALTGAACLLFLSAFPCHAIDGVAVEVGRGDDRTSVARVALTDYWHKRLPPDDVWRLAGYWEVSAAVWDNSDDSTADIGITPVFRVQYQRYYVEGAIGLHFVSTHISHSRVFSTVVQFGDHVGAGMRFGREGRYDLGVRLQHLSNGSLKQPNPGINFWLVRFQVLLE